MPESYDFDRQPTANSHIRRLTHVGMIGAALAAGLTVNSTRIESHRAELEERFSDIITQADMAADGLIDASYNAAYKSPSIRTSNGVTSSIKNCLNELFKYLRRTHLEQSRAWLDDVALGQREILGLELPFDISIPITVVDADDYELRLQQALNDYHRFLVARSTAMAQVAPAKCKRNNNG